jgi:hypothetical protein
LSLKPEDAAALIEQTRSPGTVLVGGQAVAFWARYFDIPAKLPALTRDIDYLGTRTEAKLASDRLSFPNDLKLASFDDATPNTASLTVKMAGNPEPVIIDYLSGVVGLDAKQIRSSAVEVEFRGHRLKILHPLQLLQAKFWNLYRLPEKRTAEGVERARLAVEIASAYVQALIENKAPRRESLRAVQSIAGFAATAPARYVKETHDLDCLNAVPQAVFKDGALPRLFHERRWPQLVSAATKRKAGRSRPRGR